MNRRNARRIRAGLYWARRTLRIQHLTQCSPRYAADVGSIVISDRLTRRAYFTYLARHR